MSEEKTVSSKQSAVGSKNAEKELGFPLYFENTSNASIIEVLGPTHTREYTVEVTDNSTIFRFIELKNSNVQALLSDEISVRPMHERIFKEKMNFISDQLQRICNEL